MHAIQESVSDPSDVLNSMKKYPVCHVCDDSCTFVRYISFPFGFELETNSSWGTSYVSLGLKGSIQLSPNES